MERGSVLVLCLTATACVRGVDNTKVRCTSSEYCPSGYFCSSGLCVSGSANTGGTSGRDGALADAIAAADAHPDQAVGSDATGTRGDAPSSGSDTDVASVATGAGGMAGTGAGGMVGAGGVLGTGGVTGTGSGGALAGALGSGGVVGSGGLAPSGGTVATGGIAATGGLASTGGINGTGGTGSGGTGSGGAGAGGTPCQPKSRDCTSTLDNNCDGTPDNQETSYCKCPAGQSRACQEHPGYDGKGICKAGNQKCETSTDKTTSSWSDCTGAVGPNSSEVCDTAGLDENCSGQSNEGCECVNGAQVPCECGPATTCVNGKKGTCSQSKETWYRTLMVTATAIPRNLPRYAPTRRDM